MAEQKQIFLRTEKKKIKKVKNIILFKFILISMKLFLPGKNSKIRNKQIILKLRKPGSEKKKKKKAQIKTNLFFCIPRGVLVA